MGCSSRTPVALYSTATPANPTHLLVHFTIKYSHTRCCAVVCCPKVLLSEEAESTSEGVFELVVQVGFSHFQYFQLSTCQKIQPTQTTQVKVHTTTSMASTASASSSSKKAGGALEFPAIEDEASNLVARVAASALEGKAYQQKKVPWRHRPHCKAPNHLTCACVCVCVCWCPGKDMEWTNLRDSS